MNPYATVLENKAFIRAQLREASAAITMTSADSEKIMCDMVSEANRHSKKIMALAAKHAKLNVHYDMAARMVEGVADMEEADCAEDGAQLSYFALEESADKAELAATVKPAGEPTDKAEPAATVNPAGELADKAEPAETVNPAGKPADKAEPAATVNPPGEPADKSGPAATVNPAGEPVGTPRGSSELLCGKCGKTCKSKSGLTVHVQFCKGAKRQHTSAPVAAANVTAKSSSGSAASEAAAQSTRRRRRQSPAGQD